MHYVRVDFPEQVVLGEIRRLTKYAALYEDDFLKEVVGHPRQAEETERRLKEKELKALLARDDELDGLFERIPAVPVNTRKGMFVSCTTDDRPAV